MIRSCASVLDSLLRCKTSSFSPSPRIPTLHCLITFPLPLQCYSALGSLPILSPCVPSSSPPSVFLQPSSPIVLIDLLSCDSPSPYSNAASPPPYATVSSPPSPYTHPPTSPTPILLYPSSSSPPCPSPSAAFTAPSPYIPPHALPSPPLPSPPESRLSAKSGGLITGIFPGAAL